MSISSLTLRIRTLVPPRRRQHLPPRESPIPPTTARSQPSIRSSRRPMLPQESARGSIPCSCPSFSNLCAVTKLLPFAPPSIAPRAPHAAGDPAPPFCRVSSPPGHLSPISFPFLLFSLSAAYLSLLFSVPAGAMDGRSKQSPLLTTLAVPPELLPEGPPTSPQQQPPGTPSRRLTSSLATPCRTITPWPPSSFDVSSSSSSRRGGQHLCLDHSRRPLPWCAGSARIRQAPLWPWSSSASPARHHAGVLLRVPLENKRTSALTAPCMPLPKQAATQRQVPATAQLTSASPGLSPCSGYVAKCEDSFDYACSSTSWTRSSSERDFSRGELLPKEGDRVALEAMISKVGFCSILFFARPCGPVLVLVASCRLLACVPVMLSLWPVCLKLCWPACHGCWLVQLSSSLSLVVVWFVFVRSYFAWWLYL